MPASVLPCPLPRFRVRLIADIHALAGVHGDVRHGEGQFFGDGDCPNAIIVDGEALHPGPVDLHRLVDFDVLHQLVQHPARELFGPRVLADSRHKNIRRHSLAPGALNALLQGFDLAPQLLLLVLVLGGHPGEPFLRQPSRHHVLVDTLEQGIKLPVAGCGGVQLLLDHPALVLRRLLGEAHHHGGELLLIAAHKAGQTPDLGQHHLLQKIRPDIVGGGTGSPVALIVGAVEILNLRVALVEMEMEVVAAVRADQQAGEHIPLPLMGAAFADLPSLLLHLLQFVHGDLYDFP